MDGRVPGWIGSLVMAFSISVLLITAAVRLTPVPWP
jgi:hypothetical protein